MTASSSPTVGYAIGRFNPLQNGHLALLETVRDNNDHMLVLVGSAAESRTHKNPLTFEERKSVLLKLFPKALVLPLPDLNNDADWLKQLATTIGLAVDNLRLESKPEIRLYSADATRADDYALRWKWVRDMGHDVVPVTPVRASTDLSATLVRDHWFTGNYSELEPLVPGPTMELLESLQIRWMRTHYVKPVPLGSLGAKNSVFVAFVAKPEQLYKDDPRSRHWGEGVHNLKASALGYVTRWNGELGFAGGALHQGEELVTGLRRQCRAEIGIDLAPQDVRLVASHAMIGNKGDDQHTHLFVVERNLSELYGIRRQSLDAQEARTGVAGFCVTHLTAEAFDILLNQKWAGTGLECFKTLLYSGALPKPVVEV